MGGNYVGNASTFLIETLFGLYILVVMLRFLLQWLHADFYNPISQFIITATQPPLRSLRRLIPGYRGIDFASLLLMFILQFVARWLTIAITGGSPAVLGVLIFASGDLLKLALNVFFYGIFIQVIISWVNPGLRNPITSLLHSLTEPLIRPVRNMMPDFHGFDLSPIPVLIGLQLAQFLLVAPIQDLGFRLM